MTTPADSRTATPKTILAALEMVNAARILLYTAAESLDSIAAESNVTANSLGDIANQLQDVIDAGEQELRRFIEAGR